MSLTVKKVKAFLLSLALLAVPALVLLPTGSARAQTAPACQSAGSAQAIEACMNTINERIENECNTGTPDAREACIDRIRQGNAGTPGNSGSGGQTPGGIAPEADLAFEGCEDGNNEDGCGLVDKYLNPLINLLSAAAGMAIIIMIIVGGIQYASAGGEAAKVTAAKNRIMNAIIALIAFLLMYAVLQWLVPGGLL